MTEHELESIQRMLDKAFLYLKTYINESQGRDEEKSEISLCLMQHVVSLTGFNESIRSENVDYNLNAIEDFKRLSCEFFEMYMEFKEMCNGVAKSS